MPQQNSQFYTLKMRLTSRSAFHSFQSSRLTVQDRFPEKKQKMIQDPNELWARCLLEIEQRVRLQSFDHWFRPTKVRQFSTDLLEIEVPTSFFAEWVESNFQHLIQQVVKQVASINPQIRFIVAEKTVADHQQDSRQEQPKSQLVEAPNRLDQSVVQKDPKQDQTKSVHPPVKSQFIPLNTRYTFDTFVVGEGNRFAHAAAQSVAKSPGQTQFNPLVFYGGVGLGKTHLLQAIGHYAIDKKYAEKVAYVSSEKFVSDFIQAIRGSSQAGFQRLYRSADILLVDDIQFLPKTEATQNEFFHTFNALHQSGKQIVMTCDTPPGELDGLEERLISRFQWGLVTPIEPPDIETRIAILHQKAEINGIQLPDQVATFLGNYISSNIRELEGVLNHLMAYCALNQAEVSVDVARKILSERVPAKNTQLSIEAIQQIVAEELGLTPELLLGKTRKQEVVKGRQMAMYLAKHLTKNPLTIIGLHFGRDHSTVVHAVQTTDRKCKENPEFARIVAKLKNLIEEKHPVN